MSTFEISVLAVVVVAAIGTWAYLHSIHNKLLPAVPTLNVALPAAPVTVAHLQPILNELRDLKGQVQGNSTVATVAKRVEDLHARWDKDDEKQKHDEKSEEKKA